MGRLLAVVLFTDFSFWFCFTGNAFTQNDISCDMHWFLHLGHLLPIFDGVASLETTGGEPLRVKQSIFCRYFLALRGKV